MTHIELGRKGEEYAVRYLINNDYVILEKNFRFKHSEVDIICQKNNELVVVEVKTRQSAFVGEPYKAVTKTKQKEIIKVTNQYVVQNNINNEIRLDVISIVLNQVETRLEHIENAFQP